MVSIFGRNLKMLSQFGFEILRWILGCSIQLFDENIEIFNIFIPFSLKFMLY